MENGILEIEGLEAIGGSAAYSPAKQDFAAEVVELSPPFGGLAFDVVAVAGEVRREAGPVAADAMPVMVAEYLERRL